MGLIHYGKLLRAGHFTGKRVVQVFNCMHIPSYVSYGIPSIWQGPACVRSNYGICILQKHTTHGVPALTVNKLIIRINSHKPIRQANITLILSYVCSWCRIRSVSPKYSNICLVNNVWYSDSLADEHGLLNASLHIMLFCRHSMTGGIADREGVLVGDRIVTVNDVLVVTESQDVVRRLISCGNYYKLAYQ